MPAYRLCFVLVALFVTACASSPGDLDTGPRIVSERTLGPPTEVMLQPMTITPLPILPEEPSPLELVTIDADFVLVTPTLPPSKTPTLTPTFTLTPTQTLTPTTTVTATTTAFLLPTSVIIPLTQPAPAPIAQVCDSTWFFIQPRPASCPMNPPSASQGVFQTFQNGYMVWVGSQDAIYVMYNDNANPRWQVFRDFFDESMADLNAPPVSAGPGLWNPRRGFGLLWQDNGAVRDRIGYATMEWEQPYSTQVQTGNDGVIFISRPGSAVFSLMPGGANWAEYASAGGTIPGLAPPSDPAIPAGAPGSVPLPTLRPPGL